MLNWEPVEFFQKGCNMTHFVKSEDDVTKSILDSVLDAIPSVTMGSCKRKTLNEF